MQNLRPRNTKLNINQRPGIFRISQYVREYHKLKGKLYFLALILNTEIKHPHKGHGSNRKSILCVYRMQEYVERAYRIHGYDKQFRHVLEKLS